MGGDGGGQRMKQRREIRNNWKEMKDETNKQKNRMRQIQAVPPQKQIYSCDLVFFFLLTPARVAEYRAPPLRGQTRRVRTGSAGRLCLPTGGVRSPLGANYTQLSAAEYTLNSFLHYRSSRLYPHAPTGQGMC